MKTTALPPIRIVPKVRRAIEPVLDENETLSEFVLWVRGPSVDRSNDRPRERVRAARPPLEKALCSTYPLTRDLPGLMPLAWKQARAVAASVVQVSAAA
jgi:hypothetical protein